jgi:hypothetical protein
MVGFQTRFDDPMPKSDLVPMSWGHIADPIVPLLDHSDCDGELTPGHCKQVAPRLRELVANWPEEDYDKRRALELADGMDVAAQAGEPLRFF